MLGAAVLVLYGGASAASTLSLSSLRTTLAEHEDFHEGLAARAAQPRGEGRTATLPAREPARQQADPRRPLDPRHASANATSSPAARRAPTLNRATPRSSSASTRAASRSTRLASAVFVDAIVDVGDHPSDQIPLTGFKRIYSSRLTRCMATAEQTPRPAAVAPSSTASRRWAWPGLAVVLLGGLGLRLWGVSQGLPYAYNADEADHFVPHAIEMFEQGTLNPHYFANPPGFTYVLHCLFALSYGGASGARARVRVAPRSGLHARARRLRGARHDRAVAAVPRRARGCGAGRSACSRPRSRRSRSCPSSMHTSRSTMRPRSHPRRCRCSAPPGCCAKAARATTCSPALAWVSRAPPSTPPGSCSCRCSWQPSLATSTAGPGAAARARRARVRGPLCAGRVLSSPTPTRCSTTAPSTRELVHQSTLSAESQGKLGAPKEGGLVYYLWSFTWGLGWVPVAGGARRRRGGLAQRAPPRLAAGSRRADVPRLHGSAGPLLRALADADLPDRLPAGGVLRRRTRSTGAPVRRAERRCAARRRRCSSWRCSSRASSTACTRASCSRAPTRAT